MTRWSILLSGRVQGVGLRFRTKMAAQTYQLTGWARNLDDGDVELELQGEQRSIDACLEHIRSLPGVRVEFIKATEIPVKPEKHFRI